MREKFSLIFFQKRRPVAPAPLRNLSSSQGVRLFPHWDLCLDFPYDSSTSTFLNDSLSLFWHLMRRDPCSWLSKFFPLSLRIIFLISKITPKPTNQTTQGTVYLSISLSSPCKSYVFLLFICFRCFAYCWNRQLLSYIHFSVSHPHDQISFLILVVCLLNYLGFSDYAITSEIKGYFYLFFPNFYTDLFFIFSRHCFCHNAKTMLSNNCDSGNVLVNNFKSNSGSVLPFWVIFVSEFGKQILSHLHSFI